GARWRVGTTAVSGAGMLVAVGVDVGHVGPGVHPPHAAVADELAVAPERDVVGGVAAGQLPVVGGARPGRGEDLALDLLAHGNIAFPHGLDSPLLAELNHQTSRPKSSIDCGLTGAYATC